jgi:hypothetical protein
MTTPYLPDVSARRRRAVPKAVWLWAVLIGTFLLIWLALSPSPTDHGSRVNGSYRPRDRTVLTTAPKPDPWSGPLLLLPIAFIGTAATIFIRRRRAQLGRVRTAETKLLDDDVGGAIADAQAALRTAQEGLRYRALMVLAQCAERRGDFAEASTLYAAAPASLRSAGTTTLAHSQFEPYADARRAFALAAADRLDEAEAILARPLPREAIPGTSAIRVRAQAVVDSKRRRYRDVLDGLAAAHVPVRECLPLRDRLLLRTVAAHARISLADPLRTAAEPPLRIDAPLADWIGRVLPSTRALLEGSS